MEGKRSRRLKREAHRPRLRQQRKTCKDSDVTSTGQGTDGGRLLPISEWHIFAVTWATRMWIVLQKDQLWILHPDEVYQSLEVAHSEVYGYGFRPYEYMSPPRGGNSTVADQEQMYGMYSMRSFLLPKIYVIVFHIADVLGVTAKPFMVGRIFHATVASFLPVSVYRFSQSVFRNKDIAALSALLTAFSVHLGVFGTHTLINSLLAPAVFYSLHVIVQELDKTASFSSDCDGGVQKNGQEGRKNVRETVLQPNGHPMTSCNGKGCHTNQRKSSIPSSQGNGHVIGNGKTTNGHIAHVVTTETNNNATDVIDDTFQNGACSGHFVCDNSGAESVSLRRSMTVGFVLGLLTYIRVDLIVFFSVMAFTLSFPIHKDFVHKLKIVLSMVPGFVVAFLIGGADDFSNYGYWFISPKQWFKFNVYHNFSSALFGEFSSSFYMDSVLLYDISTKLLTCLCLLCLVLSVLPLWRHDGLRHISDQYVRIFLSTFILFLIYSLKPHKEVRFLHNVVVLFMILGGTAIILLFRIFMDLVAGRVCLFITIFAVISNFIVKFPTPKDQSTAQWSYMEVWDSSYANDCFDYVGSQNDVTGVFSDRSVHMLGVYSLLHKDVPLLAINKREFQEYDKKPRVKVASADWFLPKRQLNVSVIGRMSNFITIQNAPLVVKHLIENPKYNYFVIKLDDQITERGFDQVFTSGNMKVMKRSKDKTVNENLRRLGKTIPLGTNATILEYEGSWLNTLGLYELAIERLELALKLDSTRIRCYQLLTICLGHIGQDEKAGAVFRSCRQQFGRLCGVPQPRVVLYQDYVLKI